MLAIILSALMGVWQTISTGDSFAGFQYAFSWLPTFIAFFAFLGIAILTIATFGAIATGRKIVAFFPALLALWVSIFGFLQYVVASYASQSVASATSFATVDWGYLAMTFGVLLILSFLSSRKPKMKSE